MKARPTEDDIVLARILTGAWGKDRETVERQAAEMIAEYREKHSK